MNAWEFMLVLNRQITEAETKQLDTSGDLFYARGDMSYTIGGPGPSTVLCSIEASTLLQAVAEAVQEIRKLPGLRAVQVEHNDLVTLGEAAQRCSRSRQSLVQLAHGQRGPGGFPKPEGETGGTAFYSWAKIADFLRGLGDDVPPVPRDLILADHALRLADELEQVDVPPGVLRSLGVHAA
ncbi:hypothetical protein ACFY2W_12895 [Streptomyces sp. NPDC001262]|uniref:hypothetical protein n=1 Tax=unclassified Streptomyces TaxID=2593676 RepID=UPI003674CCE4